MDGNDKEIACSDAELDKNDTDKNDIERDLRAKLFESQMSHEADVKRYQKVLHDLEIRNGEQLSQMRNLHEKRIAEVAKNSVTDFIVKNILGICDSLHLIKNKFQDSDPSIAQSMSIALSKISNVLSNYDVKEVSIKEGDPYDPEIHNPLEVVNKDVEGDLVHKVYTNAWVIAKNGAVETIRYGDVSIAKKAE